jgi:hypothetical protein
MSDNVSTVLARGYYHVCNGGVMVDVTLENGMVSVNIDTSTHGFGGQFSFNLPNPTEGLAMLAKVFTDAATNYETRKPDDE